ncbi:ATP-binding protein [Flavobacterium selenitireducens]|uniref:ATP-binding protein n=1 Tax=Flavobacterium selenitireducens TaxID=2722704 RepID=UPI00168BD7B2|nr:ATP-binding protein [Flavobacterium selenitireducens]MBD3581361.1 PAS domain S-box protein [Flavobacterium selenitireducens]
MTLPSDESFLQGGGELGELIRNKNWSKTPLGHPSVWPQSLRTSVRIILTSRQPMFVWWGKELINIYNDAYKSIVGGKHPECLGQPAFEVWREIWHEVEPRTRQCLEQNTGTYDEALLLLMERNGYTEETYYTFSYSPIPGDDGKPQGIICANTDDTARITGERQMRTLQDLAKALLSLESNQAIYEASLDVLAQNPQDFPFATLYEVEESGNRLHLVGKTPAHLPEQLSAPILDLSQDAAHYQELSKAIGGSSIQLVSGITERFGELPSTFWQRSSDKALLIPILQSNHRLPFAILGVGMNPYRLVDEDYIGFFRLVSDQITSALSNAYAIKRERKRAEALAEIDRSKTIFFSNISHEFRTPLTLMLGPLEEMLNDPGDGTLQDNRKNVEITHRNAMRLLRLVNSLLDFSRIEAGRMQTIFRGVCLGRYTEELASSFQSLFERAGLDFEVKSEVKSAAYVDTEMWEKIVLNLLSNAYKYTLSGKVGVSICENGEFIEMKVSDTGTGIPADEMDKLFQRFHRVRNATGRSFEGSGIGLSLVRELVQLNHGTILAESELGKGSRFTVRIPVGRAHLESTDLVDESTPFDQIIPNSYGLDSLSLTEAETAGPHEISRHKSLEKVLVVDDNSDMRAYIAKILGTQYEVVIAANGIQGLEMMDAERPDVVISDIMMPVMDGIEMMKRIKNNPEFADTPILLLSARAGEESKIEGYELGADDYLVKPFSAKELQARVMAQLRLRKSRRHVNSQLRNVFEHAPVAICLLRGRNFLVEIANERIIEIWGKSAQAILHKPLEQGLPEMVPQGFKALLEKVYDTGETYVAEEMPIKLYRNGRSEMIYVKFVYEPLKEENGTISGIVVVADDITDSVVARKEIEGSAIRYKLAIEAARMGSFDWILEEERFIFSDRLAEIFGYADARDCTHTDFVSKIHPDDKPIRDAAVASAMLDGILFYEARIVWNDGSLHWIRLNGRAERDLANQPTRMYGTVLDITDERLQTAILEEKVYERTKSLAEKNRQLQESEERYQRMTEEVQDYAILLLDTDGTILNWNKGAEKIKGYSDKEIVGKNFTIFYLPEDRERQLPQTLITEARNSGRAIHEGYRIRKDGTVFWGSVTITALHDDYDNVIGFSKVTRDLTERKISEDRMQKYNAELEFQNRELEQFAYIASHDLQEPLRKIQMFSGMLERNLHDAEVSRRYFEKINSSAERMSDLIKAVLNYSRLSRIDEHFVKVNLNEVLQNVLVDFELLAEERSAHIDADMLPTVIAVPLQINQLFSNLIGNALKFTADSPRIRLSCRTLTGSDVGFEHNLYPDRLYVELVFTDNGIGFDQKYATQIFTIFQRLNQRTSFSGTGIGLALCKKIVENHQGFITATSESGKGASFYVYLPA